MNTKGRAKKLTYKFEDLEANTHLGISTQGRAKSVSENSRNLEVKAKYRRAT